MNSTNENPFTMEKALKKCKLNGITMFTIIFTLFVLILGITAGITYSGFQSTAQSDGTLTFAVNGHQGTLTLSNTKVASYNSEDLILTFTLASETGYSTPSISGITMGSTNLTKDGNNFKNSTIIVATYSAPTLTIYRANVTGNLEVTGSSIASTYTVSIVSNNASYGTVSQASVANVPYGTGISTGNNSNSNQITINGTTITATPTNVAGYTTTFTGWSVPSGKVTSATTVTANFTRTTNSTSYIISLDNQLAETTGTIAVSPTGSTLPNITVPTKAGCLFGGYYTSTLGSGTKYYNADGTPATTWSGSSNRTIYAKWMNYIELTSPTNNVSLSTKNNAKNWDGTLEYCLSTPTNATTWTTWSGTTTIGGSTHTIYLRGTGNTYLTKAGSSDDTKSWVINCDSVDVSCNGNIMSLLDCAKASVGESITMGTYTFAYLFCNCTKLVSAPELPATTLSVSRCYQSMFMGCTGLASAPELPATTLVEFCYGRMFEGCTGLVSAPVLPATTLASSCYFKMFRDCTSLVSAPELPATTLVARCYDNMFYGCIRLKNVPDLPATTLSNFCYENMFSNCISLEKAPALPATTLVQGCYRYMFKYCASLVDLPAIPATTVGSACCESMFSNCTSLEKAPALPATTLATDCYRMMFWGCRNLIVIPSLSHVTTWNSGCCGSMFSYCTKVKVSDSNADAYINTLITTGDTASYFSGMFSSTGGSFSGSPAANITYYTSNNVMLPSGEMATQSDCIHFFSPNDFTLKTSYKGWDGTLQYRTTSDWTTWDGSAITSDSIYLRGTGNTKITGSSITSKWVLTGSNIDCCGNIENLLDYTTVAGGGHPSMASYCFAYMFNDCYNLLSSPTLPATTLSAYCYYNMFQNCTSLVKAPALPATTLSSYCYYQMFYGCTNLVIIPSLVHITSWGSYCCQNTFRYCSKVKILNKSTSAYPTALLSAGSTVTYFSGMFEGTGDDYGYSIAANTTYYTSNDVINPDGTITSAVS